MIWRAFREQRVRRQWQQVFKRITRAAKYVDSQFPRCQILLTFKALVPGDEDGETCCFGLAQKHPVL